ncbi:FAD-dependent oxidoreductase [Cupriavidus sp. CP313]
MALPPPAGRPRRRFAAMSCTFPGACDFSDVKPWFGFRPSTPDGLPIIGSTHIKSVWLNIGHGTLGLTLSAGSAVLLSEQMNGLPARSGFGGLQRHIPPNAKESSVC